MPEYKKVGYLTTSFKMFHLKDTSRREFHYHYHDFHKILILLGGDVTYCIEGRTYQLAPGDIVLVNAGEVHKPEIHSDLPYERIILYVSPDFLTEYAGEDCDLSFCFKQAYREQAHILRLQDSKGGRLGASIRALDASLNDDDYAAALRHRLLFLEFMIQLNRAALHHHIEFVGDSASNEKILSILTYLNDHLTEDLSIDDLASRFYLSRSYLMHTFKEQTGYTIGGYLLTKRLFLAKELIAAGTPITEVCYSCGFQNYSTFSRAYKKSFGIICFLREIMPSNRMPSASSCFLNACARIFPASSPANIILEDSSKISVSMTYTIFKRFSPSTCGRNGRSCSPICSNSSPLMALIWATPKSQSSVWKILKS